MARMSTETLEIAGFPAELASTQEVQVVYSTMREPDPNWRYVDDKGHKHHREGNALPTLALVEDGTYWCEICRDEHVDEHYECVDCGQTVVPGTRPPPIGGTPLPGIIHHELTIHGDVGDTLEFALQGSLYLWERVSTAIERGRTTGVYVPTQML